MPWGCLRNAACLVAVALVGLATANAQDLNYIAGANRSTALSQSRSIDNAVTASQLRLFERHLPKLHTIISVDMDGVPLGEALEAVAAQGDVRIVKGRRAVLRTPVSLHEEHITVLSALNKLILGTDLFLQLSPSGYVVIAGHPVAAKTASGGSRAIMSNINEEEVTGRVTDAVSGESLPGVNIIIKGTTIGTTTDEAGRFSLMVPSLADTLVFSFIGYETQTVPLDGRASVNVRLREEIVDTGGEVIVVGYGQQERRDVTASIASVSADDIANQPVQQIAQSLQGKISGVQITQNSGNPGSGFMMRIRGVSSVNDRSTEPLYVVDGNPMADPDDIDPTQIQNIEVLKSASATAIYGARGANGVVLITTRGGRSGGLRFDLDMYNGVRYARKVPMTNAREYALLYNEAVTNAGQAPIFANPDAFGDGTDWQDVAYRPAGTRSINMAVSGGNEASTYYVSGHYEKDEGVVRTTHFDRFSLRVNSEHRIAPFIRIGENIAFSRTVSNGMDTYSMTGFFARGMTDDPTVPVKNPDGSWGILPRGGNLEASLQRQEDAGNGTERPVFTGSAFIDINPLKHLTFRSQYNLVYGNSKASSFTPAYFISTTDQNELSSISLSETSWSDWNLENTLNYKNTFGKNDVELLAGFTAQKSWVESWSAAANDLPANATQFDGLRYLGLAESGQDVDGDGGGFSMLSYLGRVNYVYNDRYLATVNYRIDGSSKFGENNRIGYFPSFSLGWRASSEGFMQNIGWVDNLLLRGGWGRIGSQAPLPYYAFSSAVTRGMDYTFNDNWMPGQAPTGSGNPNLKWESIEEVNLGASFTGFDYRFHLDLDYYHKTTTDMLLQVPVVAYSGVVEPAYKNGGEIVNKGVELALGYQNTTTSGLYYSVDGNVSYNRNELTSLTAETSTILGGWISFIGDNYTTRATVGHPIGVFYGYVDDGLFQNQAEVDAHATQPNAAPGDIRFKDLNGDGVINDEDQTYIGNPWPDYTFGLSANLAYKSFDLSLGFAGTYGNDIFAAWKWTYLGGNWFNKHKDALNRWTGEGTSNDIPRMHINDPNNNLRNSTWYIEDGSYLRLHNLQVGYTIPQGVVNVRKLRVYVAATNLFTITGYSGQDPELGTSDNVPNGAPLMVGIDAGHYAVPRTYTVGINLGL